VRESESESEEDRGSERERERERRMGREIVSGTERWRSMVATT
jgi:hypothetical protein